MNYTEILADSWKLFVKHKAMWVYGLLLALVGQGGYSVRLNLNQDISPFKGDYWTWPLPAWIKEIVSEPLRLIAIFALLGAVAWLVSMAVSALGRGALIGMAAQARSDGSTSTRDGWKSGRDRFAPMFGLSLLLGLPGLLMLSMSAASIAVLVAMGMSYRAPGDSYGRILPVAAGAVALICAGVIVLLVLGGIAIWARRACVLERLSASKSIVRGWQVLRGNLGHTILNAIVLAIAGSAFSFVASLPLIPLMLPLRAAMSEGHATGGSLALVVLIGLYALLVNVGFGGILTTFNETVWTRMYQAIAGRGVPAQRGGQ